MANVKITDLTALSAADAADADVFVVVDVSADQTKKMTKTEATASLAGANDFATYTLLTANINTVQDNVAATESRRVANVTLMNNEDTALQARIAANTLVAAANDLATFTRLDANINVVSANAAAVETRRTNNIAGAVSTIITSDLTASRALVSSGSGKVAISDITSTELGHLDGVSGAIQTQLDAKIATTASASNDFVTFTRLNANLDIVQDNVAAVSAGAVSLSNILHTTSTANSYATGGTTSNLDKVLVFLNGVYQNENQYVLGNSTHNVQFKDATLVAGLELEIRKT